MTVGPVRARALTIAVSSLLLFQAAYATPSASAATPSASPDASAIPVPSATPDSTPVASPAPTPSASAAPSPSTAASATPAPTPSATPAPTATPDPRTGLKPGATELAAARTEYSQTYDNHDGTKATQFYADPVFYRPAGSTTFEPIVVGFAPSATRGVTAVSAQAPVSVAVADSSGSGDFLATTYGSRTIGFRLPAAVARTATPVTPTVAGEVADYANLLPGVDLRVIANAHGAKSFFVWHAIPADPTLQYVVDAPGLTLVPQPDGSIALVDAKGTTVATIPHPYAVDSTPNAFAGGGRYTDAVTLSLDPDGTTVSVHVDPGWLKGAVYPVYVDPSTGWVYNAGSNSYGDAHTASAYPGDNFQDYQRPDSPYYHELWNGTDPSGTSGASYDFLRWDLSAYANTTVDSASLRLYPYHQYYNAPTTETTYVRRVTGYWTESSLTWNNMPNYTTTNTASAGCVEATMCTWNVAAIVQLWLQGIGAGNNYGFQVDTIGKGSTYWKRFIASEQGGSNRPALTVTYHVPTVTSTTPAFTGAVSWSFADSGSASQTKFHVDIATSQANLGVTNVATSGDVTGNATAWHIVPTSPGSMTDDTAYWYRVRAYNGTGWSTWAQGQFTWDAYQRGDEPYYTQVPFDLGGGWNLEVGVHNGAATLSRSLFTIPSYGPPQALELSYSSAGPTTAGMFGNGWSSNLTQSLTFENGLVVWHRPDGGRVAFPGTGCSTSCAAYGGHFETLAAGTSLVIMQKDQTKLSFQTQAQGGHLLAITNRFGKALSLAGWGTGTVTATDASGRQTILTVDTGNSRITQVRDSALRTWTFAYTGTGTASDLTSITEPDPDTTGPLTSAVTTFAYTSHQLTTVTRARRSAAGGSDNIVWTIGYTNGLVSGVKDPILTHPNLLTFAAGTATYQQVTDDTTPGYATTTYALDGLGRAAMIAEPESVEIDRSYTAGVWNATSESTPVGTDTATEAWTWDAQGNLLRESDTIDPTISNPDPTTNHVETVYTYNATNDVLTKTDANNNDGARKVTRYTYDAAGHRTSEDLNCTTSGTTIPAQDAGGSCTGAGTQDASTNVLTNSAYTANDQLASEQDPLGRVTKHIYDSYGNETAVISDCTSSGTTLPSPFTSCTTVDASTGGTHDAQTNVITTTAYSQSVTAGKIGLPTSSTDAVGNVTQDTYDELGELTVEVLPSDASIPALTNITTYDQFGNTLTETASWTPIGGGSAVSRQTSHIYDLANRETAVSGPAATPATPTTVTTTTTGYDPAGNALTTTVSGPSGVGAVTTTRQFDGLGRTTSEKVGSAAATTYTYTPLSVVQTKTLPDSSVQTATWNLAPSLTELQATSGSGTTTAFQTSDVLGRVTSSINEVGAETRSAYGRLGRTTSETVAYGTTAAATTSFAYDRAGNQVSVTDPMGIVTTTTYDPLNRATVVIKNDVATPSAPTDDITTTTYYDAAGNVVAVKGPHGVTARTILNARGLGKQAIADCTDTGTTPTSNPAACTGAGDHTDSANVVTNTTYDGSGSVVKTVSAAGRPAEATTETAYDAAGRVQATKDAMGTITRSLYNTAGQLTDTYVNCTTTGTEIPADWANCTGLGTADRADGTYNLHTSTTYDDRGNQASITGPNGRVTSDTYNADGQILTVVDNDVASPTLPTEDVTTTYGYDAFGRQASVRAPLAAGNATSVSNTFYNADGSVSETLQDCRTGNLLSYPLDCNLGSTSSDANAATFYAYDLGGNLIQTTAPGPSAAASDYTTTVKTQYAYDLDNRLCRVVENATGLTNLATLTHPCTDATQTGGTTTTNVSTRYTYDGAGNLVSMIDGAGHTTTYAYDAAGNMTGRTDAMSATLAWMYDDLGRQVSQRNRTDTIPTLSVVWTYDAAGRMVSRAADSVTTTYTYDLNGNKLTATAGGMAITSTYDRLNRLLTTDDEDPGTTPDTTYTYAITSPSWTDPTGTYQVTLDKFDRATSLQDPVTATPFTWTYRADGQPSSATQSNGNAVTFSYDGMGRAASKVIKTGGTTQASYGWARNQTGHVLSEASTITSDPTNDTRQYTYDPLGRLSTSTDASTTTYGWDAVPNRTGVQVAAGPNVPTTFNAANRPVNQNGVANAFTTDADGRITARPDATGAAYQRFTWDHLGRLLTVLPPTGSTPLATYTYDPLDRLRMVDYGGGNRVRFRYVGMTTSVVQEIDDATGSVIHNIGNSWTGEHLEDWTGTGSNLRVFGANGHGDVTWTAGSTGSVTGTVRYDPYGTATSVTGSVPDFRFQGSWADDATKLSWVVTRWYAPAQGEFVSEDALLGAPRDPDSRHLYAYGAGEPVGRVDPNGTDAFRTFAIENNARLHGILKLSLFIKRQFNEVFPARLYGDNRGFSSWNPDCSRSRACITINFDQRTVSVRVHNSCGDWWFPTGWWGYGCTPQFPIVTSPLTHLACGKGYCVTVTDDDYNLVKVRELANGRLSIWWDITQSRLPIFRPDRTVNGSLAIVPRLVLSGRPAARIYYHGDGFPSEEMYWFARAIRTGYTGRSIIFQHPEGNYTDMGQGPGDWSMSAILPQ